ncbi:MAG: hypothetical protein GXP55_12870 [Deltaproteobacteria bacterium]|nr:hypothetical protein [Deltaproteobacteria bacterium]
MTKRTALLPLLLVLSACGGTPRAQTQDATDVADAVSPDAGRGLAREQVNSLALRLNLPLYWAADSNSDGVMDPVETRSLLFYPTAPEWVEDGQFTPAFSAAWAALQAAALEPAPTDERLALLRRELDQVAPTLVDNDLSDMPETHRDFARHMLRVAGLIDALYSVQVGAAPLASQVPDDPMSQSVFRRNWGPACRASQTEAEQACSAIPGSPKEPVGVYPAAMQTDTGFCQTLQAREDAEQIFSPFSVVVGEGEAVHAVPYTQAFHDKMLAVAVELEAAVAAMTDPDEDALRHYLNAAAASFRSNDWRPADEEWSRMNARNSKWYVRVAPDETYWEPCARKAGFHLTFARINQGSLEWQDRLVPVQQDMEAAIAALAGDEYAAREVSFHLPDFIDIVMNAGDDRDAFGATIGQSLPNWGPVAEEGRGRTVAMSNLYQDPDSEARGRMVARSILTEASLGPITDDPTPGLLSTILHEATHNLGPSHDYRYEGRTADEAFGGELSSMLEELKAQSGGLYFLAWLAERGLITPELQRQSYLDSVRWALGHISRGMYTVQGHHRKAYSQLAAIQVGYLMEHGVLTWDPEAPAANGEDQGAFTIDYDAFPAAAESLMREVAHLKAVTDVDAANALTARYVDGDLIPMQLIKQRYDRIPNGSLVYAVEF